MDDEFFHSHSPRSAVELQRLLATPEPNLQAEHLFDASLRGVLPFRDVSPTVALPPDARAGLFTIEEPCAGLGLTGFLPPGAMALLAPIEQAPAFQRIQAIGMNAMVLASLSTLGASQLGYVSTGNKGPTFPDGSFLLRPGESVSFGRQLATGLIGLFFQMWNFDTGDTQYPNIIPHVYPITQGTPPIGAFFYPSPFLNNVGVFGPSFRPYLRLFREPSAIPRSLSYTKVPHVASIWARPSLVAFNSVAFPGGTFTPGPDQTIPPGVTIPVGSEWLTAALTTNIGALLGAGATATSIMSRVPMAGSGNPADDMDVWWLLSDGMYHSNPGDSWRATSRGQVSTTHDVEVYHIPKNALAVQFVSPTAFGVTCMITEG